MGTLTDTGGNTLPSVTTGTLWTFANSDSTSSIPAAAKIETALEWLDRRVEEMRLKL